MQKPKNNNKNPARDMCQTPPYALEPLFQYLYQDMIWECAAGEGMIVNVLKSNGFNVYGTDIHTGVDFLSDSIVNKVHDVIVTNPPFSLKYKFFKRCCELDYPFALLMPTDVLAAKTGQALIWDYDIEILLPDSRINYKMPNKGWGGQAQFHSSWFTRNLGVGERIKRVTLDHSWEKQFKKSGAQLGTI